jgi:manganese-dependent inorganic pyrophosphatase
MGDFKKFNFSGTQAGVGQIEVMDLTDLTPKRAAILDEMNKMKEAEKLDMVVLMLTDVMKESSDLLFVGNANAAAGFEKAFGGKLANNSIYKEKCLSRKKQVIPPLEGAFKK